MLSEVKPKDENIKYSQHLLVGEPADAIAHFVDEHDIDLIVMGTHGRTGVMRLLMGSVAEEVVRKAKCGVLTVKQPTADDAEAAES